MRCLLLRLNAKSDAGCINKKWKRSKTTESGGICGYDAGKKIKGHKRHILTDTLGFLLVILVHSAGIQDRDGAVDIFKVAKKHFPALQHVFADGGYAGPKLRDALKAEGSWTLDNCKFYQKD